MKQADAIEFLQATHRVLRSQTDLSPNNSQVNTCLGRLVATLRDWRSSGFGEDLAEHPDLTDAALDLPRLCGMAECEMEKWWCRKILASDCPAAQSLAAFWYLDEYEALCRAELRLLGAAGSGGFAFLGSGAVPLTAILLAKAKPDVCVTCVDHDADACELAEGLIALLGLGARIRIEGASAEAYDPAPDDVIICASLLQAPGLFPALHRKHARRLIVRDTEGPYRFCYRPAVLPGSDFIERAKSPVSSLHINTSRYFEVCERGAGLDASTSPDYLLS